MDKLKIAERTKKGYEVKGVVFLILFIVIKLLDNNGELFAISFIVFFISAYHFMLLNTWHKERRAVMSKLDVYEFAELKKQHPAFFGK